MPGWRGAPLLAACLLAAACCGGAAAAAAGPHERACGAAFGVLRRCSEAGGSHEAVRARCCGLLDAFQHNGCLCPDCPPGASADATSAKGLLLAAELGPLMDLCDAAAAAEVAGGVAWNAASAQQQQQQAEPTTDEDDLMADMAGLAGAAQDPARAAAAAARVARDAAAARQQQPEQGELGEGLLQDTPEDDYENFLSDADAAFMLVDPAVAAAYASEGASAASRLAARLADEVAAGLAAGRAAAAGLEARLEGLLGRQQQQRQQQPASEAEAEASASAGAVDDEGAAEEYRQGRGHPMVRLAPADAVPQSAEQRRAAALAAALEAQQEAHLAQRAGASSGPQPLPHPLGLRSVELRQAGEQAGAGVPRKLSLDITIDADNPEAARRMVGSLSAVLKSWQAAGSARSQAELAQALEAAAAKVAAAASAGGALGRAGLHPKQLLLQQVEEEGSEPKTCACMGAELPPADGPAPSLVAALHRRYVATRLAMCRFACQRQQALALLLVVELALCVAWLAIWLLRGASGAAAEDEEEAGAALCHSRGASQQQQQQFLIASAADPQWQEELKQPLLGRV